MSGYDAWLERPYTDAARAEAAFEAWCENTDTDPDDPGAEAAFEIAMEDARDDAMIAAAEDRAEAAAERDW